MFDLNEQLNAWRQSFGGAEALRSADIEELEQHVRDSVASLTAKGLTEDEAFAIAIGRVGDSRPLMAEFRKVNANRIWAQRAFWMIVGFLVLQIAGMAVGAAAGVGQIVVAMAGGARYAVNATLIGVTVACWAGIVFGWFRWSRHAQGGPLSRFFSTRRWQLLGLAIAPLIAIFLREASYTYLAAFTSGEELQRVAYFHHYWADFVSVAMFLLLVAVANDLRQTATGEATA